MARGINEGFKLGGQDQINKQNGQDQGLSHVAERFHHILSFAGENHPITRGHFQVLRFGLFDLVHGRAQRQVVQVGRNDDLPGKVLPVDLRRGGAPFIGDQFPQGNQGRRLARPLNGQTQLFHLAGSCRRSWGAAPAD